MGVLQSGMSEEKINGAHEVTSLFVEFSILKI